MSQRTAPHRGAPGRPITGADIETKFTRNALLALPRDQALHWRDAVLAADRIKDAATLARTLTQSNTSEAP